MSQARDYVIVALVVCAFLLVLERGLRVDPGERNHELLTEMVYSKAGESFSTSRVLPGETTQQDVLDGVVVRGALPLGFGAGPEEAERAGRELRDPWGGDEPGFVERGRVLYGIYCSVCHDAAGLGQGNAVLRGLPPPPSLHADRARAMPDGQVFHVITFGQGAMGSYAAQLEQRERWQIVRHVRALQEQKQP